MVTRIRSWLGSLVRRTQFERDLDDELQLHIALRADDLERTGLPRGVPASRTR
jgi:hypothetical protein